MKTDKEMISDLMRRKEEYDAKRQARSKRGSYVCIMAAILAVVILEISVPASLFTAASRKGNTPASPAASVDTEPEEMTGNDRVKPDDTTSYETRGSAEDSTEIKTGNEKTKSDLQDGIIADFYAKDKQDQIVLSNDEYGRKTWLNPEIILRYEMELNADLPADHDYGKYKGSFYGYKKTSDVYSLEIKLKNTNKSAEDEILLRIEAPDCVEILSETTIKSKLPALKNEEGSSYESGNYISIPLVFRFTGEERWTDFKVYLFRRSEGNEYHGKFDHITEAEEYFASGKSMADKAYPDWKELHGEYNPLVAAASGYFMFRFAEIKGYDFILTDSAIFNTAELYERAAVYFGDVDENGVPIFITEPDHPDYRNPCRIPMLSDIPGYETRGSAEDSTEIKTGNEKTKSNFQYGITSDFYEKDKTERITLTNDEHGRKTWLTKDIIKQYGIDLHTENHPEGYDYAIYKDDIYGYKKKNDVYEIELKLKNTNEWAGDEYLIRIEADEYAEILSENTVKSVFPTVKNPEWYSFEPGDYVSIPLRFRFTGDKKCAEFRVYLFKKSDGNEFHGAHDHLTEAEEYFASGKSMADKAYPNWKDLKGEFNPLYHAASSYYGIRFIEINGYDFLLDSSNSYCSTDLYERAAVYFGETDENGVPLFITGQGPSEYFNPFRIPLVSDWPVYNGEYDRGDGSTAAV